MKIRMARELTNPTITDRGANRISRATPRPPRMIWKSPPRCDGVNDALKRLARTAGRDTELQTWVIAHPGGGARCTDTGPGHAAGSNGERRITGRATARQAMRGYGVTSAAQRSPARGTPRISAARKGHRSGARQPRLRGSIRGNPTLT